MATIAEMLGDQAQPLQEMLREQRNKNLLRQHLVALASDLEGCPLKRDSSGRLRKSGKFVSVK